MITTTATITRRKTPKEDTFNQSEKPELMNFPDNQERFRPLIPNILRIIEPACTRINLPTDRLYIEPILASSGGTHTCTGLNVFIFQRWMQFIPLRSLNVDSGVVLQLSRQNSL
jgi:hypothetical protein